MLARINALEAEVESLKTSAPTMSPTVATYANCAEALAAGLSSGPVLIDPDGFNGPIASFTGQCDMTDGGAVCFVACIVRVARLFSILFTFRDVSYI